MKVLQLYARAGFTPHTILMDKKFEKFKVYIPILNINKSAANKLISEIKRQIQMVK